MYSPFDLFLSFAIFPAFFFLIETSLKNKKFAILAERDVLRNLALLLGVIVTAISSIYMVWQPAFLAAVLLLPCGWAILIWGLGVNSTDYFEAIIALFSSVAANFTLLALELIGVGLPGFWHVVGALAASFAFFYLLKCSLQVKPPKFLVDWHELTNHR